MPFAEQPISTQVLLGLLKDYNRPYDKIMECFKTKKRIILNLTCGLGKTLISLWIAKKLKSKKITYEKFICYSSIAYLRDIIPHSKIKHKLTKNKENLMCI